jgi:predicted nucleotidyltransferase
MRIAMDVDQAFLDEVVRRILAVRKPDRIILFGSAATGTMGPDSDVDLLVLEEAPENIREEMVVLRRAIGDMGMPFDVLVMRTERFESTKNLIGGLAFPANKFGRVLYAA